jgi:hypothetical protein
VSGLRAAAQHVSDTIMPIIRSSRVLYKWLLPSYLVLGSQVVRIVCSCGLCVRFARKPDILSKQ